MAKMKLTTAEWLEHVASQVNSECSQRAYCNEYNLSLSTFSYWKKRYVKIETSENQELVGKRYHHPIRQFAKFRLSFRQEALYEN